MAWFTERVVAGEIANEAEARMSQLPYTWFWADTPSHTGRYAPSITGAGSGLGHWFAKTGSIRIGYWMQARGWWIASTFEFFLAKELYHSSYTYERQCWRITLDWDTYSIRLEEYDVLGSGYIATATNFDPRALLGSPHDWKHISLYYVPSTGVVKFWVNGDLLIDRAMIWANASSKIYAAASAYLANSGGYVSVDDLYFEGSSIVEAASIPPARRYYQADPDGIGNYSQWTPNAGINWQTVDETAEPDDDVTYVDTGLNGKIDTYAFSELLNLYPEITVDGVAVQAYCRMHPVDGIGSLIMKTRLASVDDDSSIMRIVPEKTYEWGSDVEFLDWCVITGWFPTDPAGATWTEASFNSAEFGIESARII